MRLSRSTAEILTSNRQWRFCKEKMKPESNRFDYLNSKEDAYFVAKFTNRLNCRTFINASASTIVDENVAVQSFFHRFFGAIHCRRLATPKKLRKINRKFVCHAIGEWSKNQNWTANRVWKIMRKKSQLNFC